MRPNLSMPSYIADLFLHQIITLCFYYTKRLVYEYMNRCDAIFRPPARNGVSRFDIAFSKRILAAHSRQRIIIESKSSIKS
jgi:hypothetical protein